MSSSKSAKAKVAGPPKRPAIAICDAIVRRFLKPDANIDWTRDMPAFTRLWQAYPSLPFWQAYELPFKLNMMTWFESEKGKEELARAWLLWNYTPPPLEEPTPTAPQSALDAAPEPAYTAPKLPPRRARSVAEFMKVS